jgi:DNA-3-methyladenine glycosylase II
MYKKAISHFKKADPILYAIVVQMDPFELSEHPQPFIRLIRSIIGQQLSVKAAQTIFERFESLFYKKDITPNGLLKITDEKLRATGISYQKISYLKDLASKVLKKEVELEKIADFESEIVIEQLTKTKGIGRWTAEMFLMFSLGRPDIFSFGDLGLQNAIKKAYGLKKKPTIKQMEKFSKKWSPFRTYAALALWRSLANTPK